MLAPWDAQDQFPGEPGLKQVYQENAAEILKTKDFETEQNNVVSVFNLPTQNLLRGSEEIIDCIKEVYSHVTHAARYQVSLGFIFWHAGQNRYNYFAPYNSMIMQMITTAEDLQQFLSSVRRGDLEQTIRQHREDALSYCRLITNVVIRVYRAEYTLGHGKLPHWLWKKQSLLTLDVNQKGQLYTDHLCMFRCIAYHKNQQWKGLEHALPGNLFLF